MSLTPDVFESFYESVHGYQPFPWQSRLARQVAAQGWPAVLALPTAAGKTSAIDIAVFALALQAGEALAHRSAPLRVFFVIDRRLVVDQTAEHARRLSDALMDPEPARAVRLVADALRRFGGDCPLHVATLRGGMYRDDSWAKAPNQPTVCVTTVDQVGSRLLFRGYGVSDYARPVHAALTGNDALYLVDEAHLSGPFLETLRAIQKYRGKTWADQLLQSPFSVVEISATPQTSALPFILSDEDGANPELARRLAAPKPAYLVETTRFEQEVADLAVEACSGDVKVVGVIVNRVASARGIFARLPGKEFDDKVLLTGRIRPWDRDALLDRFLSRVRAARQRTAQDLPLLVVATMTVEVGADLDFDHLITEAAPLAALRQRFGRLDRLGRFGKAGGAILLRRGKGPDPIYGDDLSKSWEWLQKRAAENGGAIDFGIKALQDLIDATSDPPPRSTPRHAPILFPAHLDSLVQTSPAPRPSPDVAPFLHGPEAMDTADVQVVWRADLSADETEDWFTIVEIAPPRLQEALPLPVQAVRTWLQGGQAVEVADIEGVGGQEEGADQSKPVLRWRGLDPEESQVIGPGEIRPGDTVVVPAGYGGADAFGWFPQSTAAVSDVGDLCVNALANQAPENGPKRLIRLRLYPGFGAEPCEGEPAPTSHQQVQKLRALLEAGEAHEEASTVLLTTLTASHPPGSLTAAVVDQLARSDYKVAAYPSGVVLSARVKPGFFRPQALNLKDLSPEADDSTDTDDISSIRAGLYGPVEVTLEKHTDGVVRWTESFTKLLGVDGRLSSVLSRAAQYHDLGKADPRFQFLLYGDEPGDTLLAKSGRDQNARQYGLVRELAGLPRGFRHEMVSVALVRRHAGEILAGLEKSERELVEYLIGTHHGRARPLVPVVEENTSEGVTLTWAGRRLSASPNHRLWRLDAGWPDCFWRLVRRHGYWGLAYLEAILRLADTACSAAEQRRGEGNP